jgi:transposase
MRAARLFENGYTQAEVARTLAVSRQSVHRWYWEWKSGGTTALRGTERVGRQEMIGVEDHQKLLAALTKGAVANGFPNEVWTLERIAILIDRMLKVKYSVSSVWRLMQRLGWSVQRPNKKARERDEKAIKKWKSKRWPAIKKTPNVETHGSYSKTRPESLSDPSSHEPGRQKGKRQP